MSAAGANYEVELSNIADAKAKLFEFKILLLGAGESGKSTIVKQLKMIHTKGKKVEDNEELVITSLHQNVIDCVKALILAVRNFGYKMTSRDDATSEMIEQRQENDRISPDEAEAILELWNSKAVQKAYGKRNEFWLLDSWPYYVDNLRRFAEENFRPTEDDMLMARIRTTGIVETRLEQKVIPTIPDEPESITFIVVDVGGQRNERKKWMHCFDDVKCILFVVNLAGYNQVLFEDSSRNRMHEAKELFERVANNQLFKDTPLFLFLNKKDLFESMSQTADLSCCFPEYDGGLDNFAALSYIEKQFVDTLRPPDANHPPKTVITLKVSASIRKDVKAAFEEVKQQLYFSNKAQLVDKLKSYKAQEEEIRRKMNAKPGCCTLM